MIIDSSCALQYFISKYLLIGTSAAFGAVHMTFMLGSKIQVFSTPMYVRKVKTATYIILPCMYVCTYKSELGSQLSDVKNLNKINLLPNLQSK
jgi:hypothetical protein